MNKEKQASSSGIGFGALLTLLFIALKLIGTIHWKWIWVLSPMWIGIVFVLLVYMAIGIVAFVVTRKRKRK